MTSINVYSQFIWRTDFSSVGFASADGLSIDSNDNLYVIGNFENGINLAGASSGAGSFVLKLSKEGTPIWHKIIRYPLGEYSSLSQVGTDAQGNVYVSGMIQTSMTIEGHETLGGGRYNAVVAKLSANGDLIWTRVLENLQGVFDMKVNGPGKVLAYAGSSGFESVNGGGKSAIVGFNAVGIMINEDGSVAWIKGLGDPLRFNTFPKVCAIDDSGNAYFHGIFNGGLSIGTKNIMSTGGHYDFFFVRINADETCAWLTYAERKIPEYENPGPIGGILVERGALQVDDDGTLYAAGNYWHGMKIGSTTRTGASAFVLKLDGNGAMSWIDDLPTTTWSTPVENIFIRHSIVYVSGIDPSKLFFATYSTSGDLQDVVSIRQDTDISSGIAIGSQQEIYFSGRTQAYPRSGFVFEYGYAPLPQVPKQIFAEAICTAGAVNASATPSDGALEYEWEIVIDNAIIYVTTAEPLLSYSSPDELQDRPLQIRVRAVNANGKSDYSPFYEVARKNTPIPLIEAHCEKILVREGGPELKWFLDGQQVDIPSTQTITEPLESGTWYVTVSDECGTAMSNEVMFESSRKIIVPNIITPNGDNLNDRFVIESDDRLSLKVFNRWGKEVYASTSYDDTWDGRELSQGVYFYQIKGRCLTEPLIGSLTILR